MLHSLIYSLRDISILGIGIYAIEFIFSLFTFLYYVTINPRQPVHFILRVFFFLISFEVLWLFVFQGATSAPVGLVLGPIINLLFSVSFFMSITHERNKIDLSRLKKFLEYYLFFNLLYFFYELLGGVGEMNLFHATPGDPIRCRMLNVEPSYIYTPFFVIGAIYISIYFKKAVSIFLLAILFWIIFLTGAKTFIVVFLITILISVFNPVIFNLRVFLLLIASASLLILIAYNNEAIRAGLLDPLMDFDSQFILNLLANADSENVGSFQTRLLSLYGGWQTFLNNYIFGVGPTNEYSNVTNIIFRDFDLNIELLDAASVKPYAITSKGFLVSGLVSFGFIWLVLWGIIIGYVRRIILDPISFFLLNFLIISALFTEGTNYPILVVLVLLHSVVVNNSETRHSNIKLSIS